MPVSEFHDTESEDMELSQNYHEYERLERNKYLFSDLSASRKSYTTDDERQISGYNQKKSSIKAEDAILTTEPSTGRKLALMVACMYLHFTGFGMTIALGVIYVELIDAFDAPRSEAALTQSLYMGVSIGGGIFFAKLLRRFDVGMCVIVSSIFGAIALIGSSLSWNLYLIIVLIGLVLGLSQSLQLLVAYAVINWTFSKSRKAALAFLTFGQALAQLSVPFVSEALVKQYNWSGSFLILSAVMSLQSIPIGLLFYFSRENFHKTDSASEREDSGNVPMYKDLPFALYLTVHTAFASLGPVEQWFSVDLAVMRGFSTSDGALLLSINGILGLVGRISGTLILHRCGNAVATEVLLAAGFLLWAVAHVWIVSEKMFLLMVIGMIFRGLSAGKVVSLLPAIQIELRGIKEYPQTVAMCNLLAGSSQIIGGFLGGYTADVTGGYELIYYIAAAGSVYASVCVMVVMLLRRKMRKQQKYEKIID